MENIFFYKENKMMYPTGKRLKIFLDCKNKPLQDLSDYELYIMRSVVNPAKTNGLKGNIYAKEVCIRNGMESEWNKCTCELEYLDVFYKSIYDLLGMELKIEYEL